MGGNLSFLMGRCAGQPYNRVTLTLGNHSLIPHSVRVDPRGRLSVYKLLGAMQVDVGELMRYEMSGCHVRSMSGYRGAPQHRCVRVEEGRSVDHAVITRDPLTLDRSLPRGVIANNLIGPRIRMGIVA